MFNIGEEVSFFSLDEEFLLVEFKDIDNFVKKCTWYTVEDMGDTWLDVLSSSGRRTIHIENFDNEYLIFTKTQLKDHLLGIKSTNKYGDICAKIKQLYRKQEFKFQGA
jgi:hypothetical protein